MKYSIFEGNLERLEKKLVRIQNKCKKYGADFHYEVVGEEFKEVEVTVDGKIQKQLTRFIIVDVEGFAKVNDWEFVATVDHHENRNVIRNIIDIEIPERYWTSDCYCEHCSTVRRRKDTFLIHNTVTGEFKQVGRSCLRDFTGGYDAELVASYISMHDSLIEGEEYNPDGAFYGFFNQYRDLDNVLKMSKSIIAKMGFVASSSETAHPSKFVLIDFEDLLDRGVSKFNEYIVDAGVFKYYEDFNNDEYIQNLKKYYLDSEETSAYMNNMKTLFSSNYCKSKDYGYIVSAVFSYDREIEKREQRALAEAKRKAENELSEYVGNIKDKITVQVNSAVCVCCNEDGYGGLSYLYKFIDFDGNVFMWSTGKDLDLDTLITISGTVKDHKEYNGLKQTWLTRCKAEFKPVEEEVHETSDIDVMEETWNMWKEYEASL